MLPVSSLREGFRENISDVFGGFDLVNLDGSILDLFVDEVMADINVFCPFMEDVIICNISCTFGVGVDGYQEVGVELEVAECLNGPDMRHLLVVPHDLHESRKVAVGNPCVRLRHVNSISRCQRRAGNSNIGLDPFP